MLRSVVCLRYYSWRLFIRSFVLFVSFGHITCMQCCTIHRRPSSMIWVWSHPLYKYVVFVLSQPHQCTGFIYINLFPPPSFQANPLLVYHLDRGGWLKWFLPLFQKLYYVIQKNCFIWAEVCWTMMALSGIIGSRGNKWLNVSWVPYPNW